MEKITQSLAKKGLATLNKLLQTARKMNNVNLEKIIAQAIAKEYAEQAAADIFDKAFYK